MNEKTHFVKFFLRKIPVILRGWDFLQKVTYTFANKSLSVSHTFITLIKLYRETLVMLTAVMFTKAIVLTAVCKCNITAVITRQGFNSCHRLTEKVY